MICAEIMSFTLSHSGQLCYVQLYKMLEAQLW